MVVTIHHICAENVCADTFCVFSVCLFCIESVFSVCLFCIESVFSVCLFCIESVFSVCLFCIESVFSKAYPTSIKKAFSKTYFIHVGPFSKNKLCKRKNRKITPEVANVHHLFFWWDVLEGFYGVRFFFFGGHQQSRSCECVFVVCVFDGMCLRDFMASDFFFPTFFGGHQQSRSCV